MQIKQILADQQMRFAAEDMAREVLPSLRRMSENRVRFRKPGWKLVRYADGTMMEFHVTTAAK